MQVDIAFEFARVYNIEQVDVVVGQEFDLIPDEPGLLWFSNNDPVLYLKMDGIRVTACAVETGYTTILIMDTTYQTLKKLTVNVVEEIKPEEVTLNPSVDGVVLK